MSRLLRWYGASPLHLLTMLGCFALAGYAAAELLPNNAVGIPVWFAGAVIGHDLLLMPLYTLADRSVLVIFSRRPPTLPTVGWINYLRVPAVLSGLLLLIWFPLILRLPTRFPATTTLPLNPYLWHWLAVTGVLFLLSATAFALRLGAVRRGRRSDQEQPGTARDHDGTGTGKTSPSGDAHAPKDVAPPMPREQAELAASGLAGLARVGTVLPDTELLDLHGAATTLYAAAGNGTSVLVFYRGAWCPYCNIALSAYQEQLLPQLTARGIRLIAISPQKPDGSLTMQQKHNLAFTVVSDPGSTLAGRLGILTQPSDEARAAQLQRGLDLASVNADGTVTLPMPATVILDARHTVRWIDVHPDHRTRTEPEQVIAALDHLEQ